jgi:hypothetical protein
MLGHCGAIPGYQSVIGYGVDTGSSIVVLVNNQIAANTFFFEALPADNIGDLIYTTLFPSG